MSYIKTVIIPAAGIGSRLGNNLPKTLLLHNNKTILEHHLNLIKDFEKIIYVVGYKYDDIITQALKINKDIIFVNNRDYLKTNTNQSIYLCKDIIDDDFFLTFDADLIIDENEFKDFINNFNEDNRHLIGVTKNLSDNPVYANICDVNKRNCIVSGFSTKNKTKYEWSNFCVTKKKYINNDNNYVYQNFINDLPSNGYIFDNCFDIDSVKDLEKLNDDRNN